MLCDNLFHWVFVFFILSCWSWEKKNFVIYSLEVEFTVKVGKKDGEAATDVFRDISLCLARCSLDFASRGEADKFDQREMFDGF